MTKLGFAFVALIGCTRSASGDDPPQQPPTPLRVDNPAMVQAHMHAQFGELRDVERLLIAGKLDEARRRAQFLTVPASDPVLDRWHREVAEVSEAARALVASPSVDEALRREVRVSAACASCHAAAQKLPVFAAPTTVPADDGSARARMARHQWAADRLWEGMIGASDQHWRLGLDVLARSPLPDSPISESSALGAQLQTFAKRAIASQTSDSFDERARLYGEMLVTCAACHELRR